MCKDDITYTIQKQIYSANVIYIRKCSRTFCFQDNKCGNFDLPMMKIKLCSKFVKIHEKKKKTISYKNKTTFGLMIGLGY